MRDLKVVNLNAEKIWEVYGISEEKFDNLVEQYQTNRELFNKAVLEQDTVALLILFTNIADKNENLVSSFAVFLEEMENVKIDSTVKLIEVLKNVDKTHYLAYIATLLKTFNDLEG